MAKIAKTLKTAKTNCKNDMKTSSLYIIWNPWPLNSRICCQITNKMAQKAIKWRTKLQQLAKTSFKTPTSLTNCENPSQIPKNMSQNTDILAKTAI